MVFGVQEDGILGIKGFSDILGGPEERGCVRSFSGESRRLHTVLSGVETGNVKETAARFNSETMSGMASSFCSSCNNAIMLATTCQAKQHL